MVATEGVCLVRDGDSRILCMGDEEVAGAPLNEVSLPEGELIVGAGGSLEPESFWSGLIDDVRIYNRAVKP